MQSLFTEYSSFLAYIILLKIFNNFIMGIVIDGLVLGLRFLLVQGDNQDSSNDESGRCYHSDDNVEHEIRLLRLLNGYETSEVLSVVQTFGTVVGLVGSEVDGDFEAICRRTRDYHQNYKLLLELFGKKKEEKSGDKR